MAKARKKRISQLAKELGVGSKVVLDKCHAEGLADIKHQSSVSAGLEASIRDWFSTDAVGVQQSHTTVETAVRVDVTKVKAKAKAKAKEPEPESAKPKAEDAQPKEILDPSPEDKNQKGKATEKTPAEDTSGAEESTEDKTGDINSDSTSQDQPEPEQNNQKEDSAEAPNGPRGRINVPKRPEVVTPVGEQVKPERAKLSGPKLIRTEKPDPEPVRPRRGGGGGGSGANYNGGGNVPGIDRSRGPARGRGAGGGKGGQEDSRRGRGRKKRLNTRRGRSADALPTGPAKFSKADMEELDARLKGSSGFIRQRRRDLNKRGHGGQMAQSAVVTGGKVEIAEPITIKALSSETGIRSADIIKWLFKKGVMTNINSAIDSEAAMEIAMEYDIELEVKEQQSAEELIEQEFASRNRTDVKPRPPVVTVLGHVDHGKTSLLDKMRKSDVSAHEAGGITQHVGAYKLTIKGTDGDDKTVVFLDTPGHEAFTSMRSRGAKITDLVVLVVAADDGVMPQTIESINHAKAAGVSIIVALNKIDTPQATDNNIQKIYGQLAEHGLNPVEWGGETEVVKTSALTGEGVTELMEVLDYQAQLLELTADYGGTARGTVIEAQMRPGRGPVARVLVQEGQIKVGDFIVIGRAFGRVRDMTDARDQQIEQAGPATPLEISGIDEVPDAGDKFYITDTLKKAEDVAHQYREKERYNQLASRTKLTLESFASQIKAGQVRELRVVLKADVQGSLDVLNQSLEKMGNEEVAVRVIHAAVGAVTENDVVLAEASDAIIVSFNIAATPAVRDMAEQRHVDMRMYRVIYDLMDEIKQALEGLLEPEIKETQAGEAKVQQVFRISKLGAVAGCLVSDGVIAKSALIRLVRDGVIVTEDRKIETLRRVKDEAREVRAGTECGIRIAGFDDIKPDDLLVAYTKEQVKRTLD